MAYFGEMNADEDEAGYEVVEHPCQPAPTASSQQCRTSNPVSSSKFLPPMNDSVPGSGGPVTKKPRRRRHPLANLPDQSAIKRVIGEWNARNGRYFHKHFDGRVTWLEGSDDGN